MSVAAADNGRSRGGYRFYDAPTVRRQLQHQHKQQKSSAQVVGLLENRVEAGDCASLEVSGSTFGVSNLSNLDRFLEYTTPLVQAQHFSKTSMKGWGIQEDEDMPYFVLGDLWDSFKQWSAYGAGVPLLLNGSDSVVQYYVPYLSGIQLYIDTSKPSSRIRRPGEETDESSRETNSTGSSDCETERRASSSTSWRLHDLSESALQGMNGLSLIDNAVTGSSSDEGEFPSSPGALAFEYFEHDLPFHREPFSDKISALASRFPELNTYRSCDLSQSSWVSVAWYPIYRIPTGPTLQNLDSCFLTFHSLSTLSRGVQNEWKSQYDDRDRKLSLPIFGMATYKFKISVWDHSKVDGSPKANALLRAASEWLHLLKVDHPDYTFFISNNFYFG